MSQWIDRVQKHTVWELLQLVGPAIDLAVNRVDIQADAIDSLERLRTVLTFCGKRLASAEPVLVLPTVLEGISNSLKSLKVSVDTFISNGDIAQLNSANVYADNLLANLVSVLGVETIDDLTSIEESASAYRNTLEKHLRETLAIQKDTVAKNKSIDAKVEVIEAALTKEQQRLSTLISEQQSLFSAAQDKRASEFSQTQAEYLAKHSSLIAEQQTLFSSDQDTRKTEFADFQRDSQATLVMLMSEYDQKLKDHDTQFLEKEKLASDTHKSNLDILKSSYKDSANTILDQIRKHKEEVESLVGVIGNLGVTSGYKKTADKAWVMLIIWQFVTVIALVGLIGVAFKSVSLNEKNVGISAGVNAVLQSDKFDLKQQGMIDNSQSDKSKVAAKNESNTTVKVSSESISDSDFYHGLATRIFLSITFGIFAAYAGRQASHFLTIEQKNRKLALELEALGPFIEPLDKDARDKFRVQIGDRSFGVPDHEASKPKGDDPVTLAGLLNSKEIKDAIAEQVKEAIKGFK